MRFVFGDCVFDPRARRLTRAGESAHLSPKAAVLLECLLVRRPALVPQAELRDLLWPETFVGYSNLGQVVAELRKAIGDADRRTIRTAYGTGYAFDGNVVEEGTAAPRPATVGFSLRWGTLEVPLREGVNLLGRGPECACRIASRRVSRQHARIVVAGDVAMLDDMGSRNGTHVGDRRVEGPTRLTSGDVIFLGHEAVSFSAVGSVDTTESEDT